MGNIREPGYYWVEVTHGDKEIAMFDGLHWCVCFINRKLSSDELITIYPEKIIYISPETRLTDITNKIVNLERENLQKEYRIKALIKEVKRKSVLLGNCLKYRPDIKLKEAIKQYTESEQYQNYLKLCNDPEKELNNRINKQ